MEAKTKPLLQRLLKRVSIKCKYQKLRAKVKFKPRLAMLGAVLLTTAGCAESSKLCSFKSAPDAHVSSQSKTMPNGCRLVDDPSSALQKIECDDGRTGFAFGSSI